MSECTIDVARDFTARPFGRYHRDGDRSGETFRDKLLIPALRKYDHVTVELSGTNYYGSSFLEEAFGGLLRNGFKKSELLEKLKVRHTKLPSVVYEVYDYIGKVYE